MNSPSYKRSRKVTALSLLLVSSCLTVGAHSNAHGATLPASPAGISVTVDETTGAYSVNAAAPQWTFSGTVGGPMTQVVTAPGRDQLGNYQEIKFQSQGDPSMLGRPYVWQGAIRNYQGRPLVSFAATKPDGGTGPTPDFPAFTTLPQNLHALNFHEGVFSPPRFTLENNATPWFLFNDAGQTVALSAASDFLVAQMHGDGKTLFASGLLPTVAKVPAGFTHRSFMVVDQGIGKTFHAWGNALTDLNGKPRTTDNADNLIKYLGYWTDNGATYYYNYDKDKGYEGTLLALRDHYQEQKIPLRYLQLDSWWYQKTRVSPAGVMGGPKNAALPEGTWNAYGGTLDYSASPALFPQGLSAFQQKVDLPLAVHARWIDPSSPYLQQYKISGLASVDPRWWNERMAYLKTNGVICYEQDWLNEIFNHSPEMARDVTTGAAFTDNMARSAQANGLTLQYCMALPRFFMQGSKYPNLTTIRTSGDRFERGKWNDFIYTSLLADSLRIRPWADVFLSTEMGNVTIATLSSGPVGVGDPIGKESRANLMKVVRADGVIIKPDTPLVPTDATILADARQEHKPLTAATHTDTGQHTAYVFAYTRRDDAPEVAFTPAALGFSGPVYVYSTAAKTGQRMDAGETFRSTLGSPNWDVYIVAPVGRSGIAFLGDAGKIVGTGRQRVPLIRDEAGALTATLLTSPGEEAITLHGYAATLPSVKVTGGNATPLTYDAATGYFSTTVTIATKAQRINGDPDPVRQATVKFQTGRTTR